LDSSSLSRLYFFRRGMTEQSMNCLGKTPELKDRLTMFVMVGRIAGRNCFKREVGIRSRSQRVLDDWDTSLRSPLSNNHAHAHNKCIRHCSVWILVKHSTHSKASEILHYWRSSLNLTCQIMYTTGWSTSSMAITHTALNTKGRPHHCTQ